MRYSILKRKVNIRWIESDAAMNPSLYSKGLVWNQVDEDNVLFEMDISINLDRNTRNPSNNHLDTTSLGKEPNSIRSFNIELTESMYRAIAVRKKCVDSNARYFVKLMLDKTGRHAIYEVKPTIEKEDDLLHLTVIGYTVTINGVKKNAESMSQ